METPSGPRGRRARWHQILSRFDISVQYIPGPENLVADAMSRWAYPAGGERDEVSVHGSLESCLKVRQIQEQAFLERECRRVSFHGELAKPKALDLFSGTGSVSTVLKELGYQVVSLDFSAQHGADLTVDILVWEYWRIPPRTYEIIVASPPCTEFSVAKTPPWKSNFH